MSSHPVPYNYPPFEVLYLNDVFDPTLRGTVNCSPGMKTWRTLFPYYHWANPGLRSIDDWAPDTTVSAAYCNYVGPPPPGQSPLPPPPRSNTFILARVPKAILTKIMITIRLSTPLAAGDFDPLNQFWTTAALDTTKPWIIGYTEGSTDSMSYKRAVSMGDDPDNPWLEFFKGSDSSVPPNPREGNRNMILCWNGLDDFVAQCDKVENFTTITANDTYKYTIDTLKNGVHMTPGDRLCFLQPYALLSKIATFYITLEFAQDPVQPHAPYHDSGYKQL